MYIPQPWLHAKTSLIHRFLTPWILSVLQLMAQINFILIAVIMRKVAKDNITTITYPFIAHIFTWKHSFFQYTSVYSQEKVCQLTCWRGLQKQYIFFSFFFSFFFFLLLFSSFLCAFIMLPRPRTWSVYKTYFMAFILCGSVCVEAS